MYIRIRGFPSFTFLLLVCFALGCNTYETEEANKLVEAGNAAVTEALQLFQEASSKTGKIFDSINIQQHPKERDSIKDLAQEAASEFEKSAAKYRESAAKYDEASKLKVQEQLKEYLKLKSQEFNKRAEQADITKEKPKALLESDNADDLLKKVKENEDRGDKLEKEADDLAEKSHKIKQENKGIFKPDSK
jgi:hypothetical protein